MTTSGAAAWWHEAAEGTGISQALDMELLHEERTAFQEIGVYNHPTYGRVLTLDGTVQLSQADEFIYHEMAVHVPLQGRSWDDVRVLIVGGGDGGILREVLRCPFVSEVVMAEIDRRVIELSNAYVGVQGQYDDPRVTLVIDDAVRYVAEAAEGGRQFDLVIIDATDSTGPTKVLLTRPFYHNLHTLLSPRGVVVDSDILLLGNDGGRLSRDPCDFSVYDIARSGLFARVEGYGARVPLYPGGPFAFFLYSKDGHSFRTPVRSFEGRYYDAAVHAGAFALPTWWRALITS
jgi:spermidine synthase